MSNNPAQELLSWLNQFSEETREDINMLIAAVHPATSGYRGDHLSSQGEKLGETIAGAIAGSWADVGIILSYRSAFDFLFLKKRGTREGWKETQSYFQALVDDPQASQAMKARAESSIKDIPNRAHQWIAICDSWKDLKTNSLSDEKLHHWQLNYMHASI